MNNLTLWMSPHCESQDFDAKTHQRILGTSLKEISQSTLLSKCSSNNCLKQSHCTSFIAEKKTINTISFYSQFCSGSENELCGTCTQRQTCSRCLILHGQRILKYDLWLANRAAKNHLQKLFKYRLLGNSLRCHDIKHLRRKDLGKVCSRKYQKSVTLHRQQLHWQTLPAVTALELCNLLKACNQGEAWTVNCG